MRSRNVTSESTDRADEGGPSPGIGRGDHLSVALLDSRERWRHFATLANDIFFETDLAGRISFISPSNALGYAPDGLLGTPGISLLADDVAAHFNPFQHVGPEMRRSTWLHDAAGNARCYLVSVCEFADSAGDLVGVRGVAQDITSQDEQETAVTGALRRGELLEYMMRRMRQEFSAASMMRVVLEALMNALGSGGVALLNAIPGLPAETIPHAVGTTPPSVIECAADPAHHDAIVPLMLRSAEGHSILVSATRTRLGEQVILTLWRGRDGRAWDSEDSLLASAVTNVVAVVLDHEAIQRAMTLQARTDPLTGLLNRLAFFEEMERRINRSERDALSSVLVYIDLDHFTSINDVWGHKAGDDCLRRFGETLRLIFRPTDLVARLGSDEFAVWMDGSDQFTAAERAEQLRLEATSVFRHLANGEQPDLGASIGLAQRSPRSGEGIDSLSRRADLAVRQVKRSGRGGWLVSNHEPIG